MTDYISALMPIALIFFVGWVGGCILVILCLIYTKSTFLQKFVKYATNGTIGLILLFSLVAFIMFLLQNIAGQTSDMLYASGVIKNPPFSPTFGIKEIIFTIFIAIVGTLIISKYEWS